MSSPKVLDAQAVQRGIRNLTYPTLEVECGEAASCVVSKIAFHNEHRGLPAYQAYMLHHYVARLAVPRLVRGHLVVRWVERGPSSAFDVGFRVLQREAEDPKELKREWGTLIHTEVIVPGHVYGRAPPGGEGADGEGLLVLNPGHQAGLLVGFGLPADVFRHVPLSAILQTLTKETGTHVELLNENTEENPMRYVLWLHSVLSQNEQADTVQTLKDLKQRSVALVGSAIYELHVLDALVPAEGDGRLWVPYFAETAASLEASPSPWTFFRHHL